MENNRKCLSEAILSELDSWPHLNRQVFILAHYRGHSTEQVGSCLGLAVPDVRQILAQCERKLRAALRQLRDDGEEGVLVSNAQLPMESRGGYLF
jgi:DNA-directed RNA polymerase specialized sigma24 family protein